MKFPEHSEYIRMEYRDFQGDIRRLKVTTNGTGQDFLTVFRSFLSVCGFQEVTIADLLNEDVAFPQEENPDR